MPFAVIATYTCAADDVDEIRARLLTMREHTVAEPANLAYLVHETIDPDDETGGFILYEQYTDRAGFEAHHQTAHFEEHVNGFIRPLLLDRTVQFAEVLSA